MHTHIYIMMQNGWSILKLPRAEIGFKPTSASARGPANSNGLLPLPSFVYFSPRFLHRCFQHASKAFKVVFYKWGRGNCTAAKVTPSQEQPFFFDQTMGKNYKNILAHISWSLKSTRFSSGIGSLAVPYPLCGHAWLRSACQLHFSSNAHVR